MRVRAIDYFFVALCDPFDEVAKAANYRPRVGDYKPVFIALDIRRGTLEWMYRLSSDNPQNIRERTTFEASKISMKNLPRYCEEWCWLESIDEYDVRCYIFISSYELNQHFSLSKQVLGLHSKGESYRPNFLKNNDKR